MKVQTLALLAILLMVPAVLAEPRSRQSETTNASKGQEAQAKAWWFAWQQKHPEAAEMTWESLGPEYKEEVEARVVDLTRFGGHPRSGKWA
jgi:hypothetical protein